MNRRDVGRFSAGQLRTLQRRFLAWRLKAGPGLRSVLSADACARRTRAIGFYRHARELRSRDRRGAVRAFAVSLRTDVLELGVSVSICPSESFEAVERAGMQTAFWRLGGVPIGHRTEQLVGGNP